MTAHEWEHVATYQDGSSASRFARKAREPWQRVQDDIAAGRLDVLVIWEPSRGSRDPAEWLTFLKLCRKHRVRLHVLSHDRTYSMHIARDWRTMAEDGVDAGYESEKINDRVRRGTHAKTAEGRPHGRPAYGYSRSYDDRRRPLQHVDPETAPVVREIFERVSRRDPIVRIVKDLNARLIAAPGGGDWGRHTIRTMIRNVVYLGQRRLRSDREVVPFTEVHEGSWEALVGTEVWHAANGVLDEPDRRKSKPDRAEHLLSYVAQAKCGGPLRVQPAHDGRLARYACHTDGCTARTARRTPRS